LVLYHALVDLSLENPRGRLPESYLAEIAPEYELQVRVAPLAEAECHRVDTMVRLSARAGIQVVFVAELTYRAEVQLHLVPAEDVQRVLHVEVPEAMFPVIKEVFETNGRYAGYPGVHLDGLDFAKAFATGQAPGHAPV
jgi:preprotein translocase subunit SecB